MSASSLNLIHHRNWSLPGVVIVIFVVNIVVIIVVFHAVIVIILSSSKPITRIALDNQDLGTFFDPPANSSLGNSPETDIPNKIKSFD